MTMEKTKETVEYYNTCKTCGEEFQVWNPHSAQEYCEPCRRKAAAAHAEKRLAFLIGAKITCMKPVDDGSTTSADELEYIEVETIGGKRILFNLAGWGDHYIEWSERSVS